MWFFINSINSGQCYAGSGEKWGNLTENARKVGCFGEKRRKIASRRPLRRLAGPQNGRKAEKGRADARRRGNGRNLWGRPAGEAGSPPISRVLSNAPKDIGQSFILAPRYRGAPAAYPGATRATPLPPYLALLRMGFAMPVLLPVPRWALTPPFHPCLIPHRAGHRRFVFCCTFRRLAAPGR